MNDVDVFNVIQDHIADGKLQHPEIKPLGSYSLLVQQWGVKLEKANDNDNATERYRDAGKLLIQLAGICIRGIDELNLPITMPEPRS